LASSYVNSVNSISNLNEPLDSISNLDIKAQKDIENDKDLANDLSKKITQYIIYNII
jgi:hypothetical protein